MFAAIIATEPQWARAQNAATPTDHPFRIVGNSIDELSETWSWYRLWPYRNAIQRFPTIESCLVEPQNLASFDWTAFRSLTEVRICLAAVGDALGSPSATVEWFALQGFSTSQSQSKRPAPRRGSPSVSHTTVFARWEPPETGAAAGTKSPLTGVRAGLREIGTYNTLGLAIQFDDTNSVFNVSASYPRKQSLKSAGSPATPKTPASPRPSSHPSHKSAPIPPLSQAAQTGENSSREPSPQAPPSP